MRNWLAILATGGLVAAQVQQPQPRYFPTGQERGRIEAKSAELHAALRKLEANPLYADAGVYGKAGDFILAHPEEFVSAAFVKDTLDVLDKGLARASELAAGSPSWTRSRGRLV